MAISPIRTFNQCDFTPVPLRSRTDGWTAARQRAFIAALRARPCIEAAARAVGMSRESAYRLRRHAGAESFVAAWDAAMAAVPRGETSPALRWHRALYGIAKPIMRGGVAVGQRLRPDDDALLGLMRRLDPGGRSQ
jgi:hypothetical protein